MPQTIAIINYNMGNIFSVQKKLTKFNCNVIVTNNVNEIINCDKIILPGVGHFARAMQNLEDLKLIDVLNTQVLINKKPILGICLGMQLFANHSEEGHINGLGWVDAQVVRFRIKDTLRHKVPHTGWNQVSITKQSKLFNQINDNEEFYFVHSYHYQTDDKSIILNQTNFEYSFISAIEKENIFGVQYHPEKSHDSGEQLLRNFILL